MPMISSADKSGLGGGRKNEDISAVVAEIVRLKEQLSIFSMAITGLRRLIESTRDSVKELLDKSEESREIVESMFISVKESRIFTKSEPGISQDMCQSLLAASAVQNDHEPNSVKISATPETFESQSDPSEITTSSADYLESNEEFCNFRVAEYLEIVADDTEVTKRHEHLAFIEELEQENRVLQNELERRRQTERDELNSTSQLQAQINNLRKLLSAQTTELQTTKQSLLKSVEKVKDLEAEVVSAEFAMTQTRNDYLMMKKLYESERGVNLRMNESIQQLQGDIRVLCRIRPKLPYESGKDQQDFGDLIEGEHTTKWAKFAIPEYSDGAGKVRRNFRELTLERIFGPSDTNADVFQELEHLLLSGLAGKTVTIFAYGASGTGKSHTLNHQANGNSQASDEDGIIPRTVALMFRYAEEKRATSSYVFSLSATEIYIDNMYDLLSGNKMAPKITLGQESWNQLTDWESANTKIASVLERRRQRSTTVNQRSSRSHLIFRLRSERISSGSSGPDIGHINIVDLAGSESIADASGQQQLEGVSINNSLGDLIGILGQLGKGLKPTPNTTLGKTLSAAFEKPARVAMLTMVSPKRSDYSSTRATLRTAEIAHKARKNPSARLRSRIVPGGSPNAEPGTPDERAVATRASKRNSASATSQILKPKSPASKGSSHKTPIPQKRRSAL